MQARFKFRVYNKENKKLYSWENLIDTKGYENVFYWCMRQVMNDFENNVLMQSTGLKDKNGKLIYEGDILELPPAYEGMKTKFVVEWRNLFMCSGFNISQEMEEKVAVIGNIYENPELLEQGANQ